ncbi:PfkB family carbohydrate kinase [Microbacterium fluvii]|uniref:PfkB family carbohydrate kinase n=1 Tax=Microbacterium fluvii TaxID=415215 RepID=A0ABW2HES0_9MICO|nr:PfkB family carbohydrate kinase [Microbacterium fluvii]MCU4671882.1 PfkB family carbohydrate kinase [Microbacterium fluvii]
MIIGGGTYREEVDSTGHREDVGGSGFRAASLLSGADVEFVTAVEDGFTPLLEGACGLLGITTRNVGRDRAVGFHYRAPFVEPMIRGNAASLDHPFDVAGEDVLAFGIVERGARQITATTLVYDPQSTDDALFTQERPPWDAPARLAISANAMETRAFTGGVDVEDAAREMAETLGAEVVVTKAGARGCLVTERDSQRQTWVGAHPTATVHKLGSGDVFSAAFAHAWQRGSEPVDAARFASAATAWWCDGNGVQLSPAALAGEAPEAGSDELDNAGRAPLIYLAGPFFSIEQRWLIDQCKTFLESAGARVFSPVHEIGLGGPEVAEADLAGLSRCDAVFAILDGWDPGTLFETGWATARSIPVVAAGGMGHAEGATMLLGTGAEQHADYTSAMYRAIWRGLGVGAS